MDQDRDADSGKFIFSATDDEITDFVRENSGVTARQVADEFEYKRPSAYRRLKALEERGTFESREVGGSFRWQVGDE